MIFTQDVSSFGVASAATGTSAAATSIVPNDAWNLVGSVVTSSSRQNVYSTGEWTSSGPWTTYYHNWHDANSRTQGWNMFMGDGYPNGTTQQKYSNDGQSNEHRLIEWAQENRMGFYYKDRFEYDNATGDYSGVTWRCMPIRNTTSSSITRSMSTSRTGAGGHHGGHSTIMYTPNSSGYSSVTGGSWNVVDSNSYTSESNYNQTFNISIPANTTVLVMNTSGWWNHTTYRFKDTNMFYNLDSLFSDDNSLVCDLRMLNTLSTVRIKGESSTSSNPWKIYPQCALIHGDR